MASQKHSHNLREFSDDHFENLVRERHLDSFLTYCRRFKPHLIKFHQFSTILMGYRRMSCFREGWRFLRRRYEWAMEQNLRSELNHLSIWIGYWLHITGASELAFRAIDKSNPKTLFEVRSVAEIYLTKFQFQSARRYFETYLQLQKTEREEWSYESRLVRMEYADSLSGEGFYIEALAEIKKTLRVTSEPLLRAIGLSCEVEYWSRLGHFEKALESAKVAEPLVPLNDQSVDRLLFNKWRGFAEYQLHQSEKAYRLLLSCYRSMRKMGLRPEAWLDTLRLLLLCKMNARSLARIEKYPGLDPQFLDKFKDIGVHPSKIKWPKESPSFPQIVILWHTEEWYYKEQWHLGLSLEIKCLTLIALSGFWGLYRLKLISLLWPDSHPSTLSAMEKRLEQIFQRLRKRWGLSVLTRHQYCFLPACHRKMIHIELAQNLKLKIYSSHSQVTAKTIARFYNISLSQSYKVAKQLKFSTK